MNKGNPLKPAGEPTAGDWWLMSKEDRAMIDSIQPPRYPRETYHGCATLPAIIALLVLVLLVAGCTCDCGWLTGPVHCDQDAATGAVWAYVQNSDDVNDWMRSVINHPVNCPEGQPREVCGIKHLTTVMRPDGTVMIFADLALCLPPAPMATPTVSQ